MSTYYKTLHTGTFLPVWHNDKGYCTFPLWLLPVIIANTEMQVKRDRCCYELLLNHINPSFLKSIRKMTQLPTCVVGVCGKSGSYETQNVKKWSQRGFLTHPRDLLVQVMESWRMTQLPKVGSMVLYLTRSLKPMSLLSDHWAKWFRDDKCKNEGCFGWF